MYRECLDQKFIVFESELDLKAHEVDVHGASGRVDLGFEYGYRSNVSSTSQRQKNKQPQQSTSTTTTSTTNETLISHTNFPSINNNNSNNTERTIPGQPKKQKGKQQQQRLQKPKGFGSLSAAENWPDLNQSSSNAAVGSSSSITTDNNVDEAALQRHAEFLRKVSTLLSGPQGVEQFRSLTTAYRNNTMDSSTYVKEIYKLCDNDSSKASAILKGVEELMDKENKKKEILTTWRNTQATNVSIFISFK